jgi:hypothetical protein
MQVYVLLVSGQISPVAVFRSPEWPHVLPADAVATRRNQSKGEYVHREIVGEWTSESHGTAYTLVCYVLQ